MALFRCAGSREGGPRAETKRCRAFAKAKCQGRHAVGFLARSWGTAGKRPTGRREVPGVETLAGSYVSEPL